MRYNMTMPIDLEAVATSLDPPEDTDFMELAHERYQQAKEADAEDRELAQKDVDFESGDQWTEAARKLRESTDQPVLTWNRMQTFVQQVSNDGRENKPAIQFTPRDGGKHEDAWFLQGRARQIEYESSADVAYDTSREQQIICGRGYYRALTEFVPGSMKQQIRIKPILNQFSVCFDPNAQEYDKSDAEYCFVEGVMSKSAYKRRYGSKTRLASAQFGKDDSNIIPGWVNVGPKGDQVLVCEYWLKEFFPRTRCELANGENTWKDELPESAVIVDEREEYDWKLVQYIIDAYEVLYKTEWTGKTIPIIPVFGRQEVVRGKLRNLSLIRHSHDEQRLINLYVSNIAFEIGSMAKTPQFFFEGQEEGHEDELATLNVIPRAYQLIKPITDRNGNVLPIPPSLKQEPRIQALTMGLGQAIDGLKASMGIYDASLGNAPADASGLAIQRRNQESDLGNYHFSDNEARSRKLLGRILLELIPVVDRGSSTAPVRTDDGKTKHVPIGKPYKHDSGTVVTHKLSDMADKHEPNISTGPSYTSARQQAVAVYGRLAETDKGFMQIAGDQYFRNMDFPGADVIADRYAKMLPDRLKPAGDPTQLQEQVQQAAEMVKQLSATVHQLQNEIDTKKAELETRKQIAAMQEETRRIDIKVKAETVLATLSAKANMHRLSEETDAIQHSINTVDDQASQEFEALLAHYSTMGAGDQPSAEQGSQQQADPSGSMAAQDPSTAAPSNQPTGTEI